jgi:TatA/E family protein of Tat protein translocase
VLLLFGAKRLPEIGSSLGKGIREFKSSVREIEGELKAPRYTPPPPPPPQQLAQSAPPTPQATTAAPAQDKSPQG